MLFVSINKLQLLHEAIVTCVVCVDIMAERVENMRMCVECGCAVQLIQLKVKKQREHALGMND